MQLECNQGNRGNPMSTGYDNWLAKKPMAYQKIALHINTLWQPKSYLLLDYNGWYSVVGRDDCIKNEWILGRCASESIIKFDQLLEVRGNKNAKLEKCCL